MRAGKTESRRYVSTFSSSKINLVGIALIAVAFLVPIPSASMFLGFLAMVWIAHATISQRNRMRELEFPPDFVASLFHTGLIGLPTLALFLAGKLVGSLGAA